MCTLWGDLCIKGILFHLYFKMHGFYKCSLKRIYLVLKKRKKKKGGGELPVDIKKIYVEFSYFTFKTLFFSMFSWCVIWYSSVGSYKILKWHSLWVLGEYQGWEVQLDFTFQESSVTAIYWLTNSASFYSFFFLNLHFKLFCKWFSLFKWHKDSGMDSNIV